MNELKLNETPVRTARNFNINNIKIKDVKLLEQQEKFGNIEITGLDRNIEYDSNISAYDLRYGVGKELEQEAKTRANHKLKLCLKEKKNCNIEIINSFDKTNLRLVDIIEITANEGNKSDIIVKYKSENDEEHYHNGIIKVIAKKDSNLNITIINLLNTKSSNFLSIESEIEENANVNYTVVDFGGKHSITNYYSNLCRRKIEKRYKCNLPWKR